MWMNNGYLIIMRLEYFACIKLTEFCDSQGGLPKKCDIDKILILLIAGIFSPIDCSVSANLLCI